jgi:hypothetical protein
MLVIANQCIKKRAKRVLMSEVKKNARNVILVYINLLFLLSLYIKIFHRYDFTKLAFLTTVMAKKDIRVGFCNKRDLLQQKIF